MITTCWNLQPKFILPTIMDRVIHCVCKNSCIKHGWMKISYLNPQHTKIDIANIYVFILSRNDVLNKNFVQCFIFYVFNVITCLVIYGLYLLCNESFLFYVLLVL